MQMFLLQKQYCWIWSFSFIDALTNSPFSLFLLKVKAENHNDVKSLVAAITKGLMTQQLKAHALYCWLTNIDLTRPPKGKHKSTAPATKVKSLADRKLTYAQFFQELCK